MNNYQYYYLMSLSYDGSSYYGWVKQKTQPLTVQGVFEKSLQKFIKTKDFYVLGASKTDTGVHALDQKVVIGVNFEINNFSAFQEGFNKVLPSDLFVNNMTMVNEKNDVRKVKEKTYEYVLSTKAVDVFQQRYITYLDIAEIDVEKLQEILNLFVGTHDFFLFSGLSNVEKDQFQTTRTIKSIIAKKDGELVKVIFQAEGFLRYQIRMIMGASLVCLTKPERLSTLDIQEKLTQIGTKSPYLLRPNGLFLKKIEY